MQITIIGCGNMGRALAQCLSQTNQLLLYDRHVANVDQSCNSSTGQRGRSPDMPLDGRKEL